MERNNKLFEKTIKNLNYRPTFIDRICYKLFGKRMCGMSFERGTWCKIIAYKFKWILFIEYESFFKIKDYWPTDNPK